MRRPRVMADKILFLSQSFPPRPGVAGRRLGFLAREAVKDYEAVYAIRLDRGYQGETVENVSVYVLPAHDLRSWLGGDNAAGTVDKASEPGWKSWLRKLRQSFPFVLLADDGGYRYRQAACRLGVELIDVGGVNVVFSSFRPWSDHLVARRLKKKYPNLYWIADFRDLPVDPVRRDSWWPALQRWWGKRMIRRADEVWCVSQGQAAQLAGWHPNINVRFNPLLALPPEHSAPQTYRFTIVYTGSVYPGLQSVAPLVKALRNLISAGAMDPNKLQLVYRGKDGDLFQKWTSRLPTNSLDIQPNIAPAAAQKIQKNAQLLLLLNWSAPNYYGVLTAKLWDYLASGRPILALVNGPIDQELKSIIEGAAAGTVYGEENIHLLQQALEKQYAEWAASGTVENKVDVENLKQYL